jgi:hypothetical protein
VHNQPNQGLFLFWVRFWDDFSEDWEILLTTDRVRTDGVESFLPLRTHVTLDIFQTTKT